MSKSEIVFNALKRFGCLTNIEIQQLVWTTSPHSIIRDIKKKYKDVNIVDEWVTKTETVVVNGKEKKISQRFKRYWLEVA